MTILDTALRDSLRALKLSGMLHTLDARLTQAQAGELGHLEFLQVLCHDEITRREAMGMQRRLHRARRPASCARSAVASPARPSTGLSSRPDGRNRRTTESHGDGS